MIRILLLAILFLIYGILFVMQEKSTLKQDVTLKHALPVSFYRVVAGYSKQLAAEMLFIRSSVFIGSVKPGPPLQRNEAALTNNFKVMTNLYPRFIDPYFYTNSFIAPLSQKSAIVASEIFEEGIAAYPENLVLRFFYASNIFLRMNQPAKAAQAFTEAAELEGAPPMFEHLAALLSAEGGDIAAGLISLKAMLSAEDNELVRKRYQEEIGLFEKALELQEAVNDYIEKYGDPPEHLEKLVPQFLKSLPEFRPSFVLEYKPPVVHLKRPRR